MTARLVRLLGLVVLVGCQTPSEESERATRHEEAVFTTCGGSAIPSNTTWEQPGYSWWQNQQWFLKGDGLTPTENTIEVQFTEPPGITGVHVNWHCVRGYLKNMATGSVSYLGTSTVTAGTQTCGNGTCLRKIQYTVGTAQLTTGEYKLLLAADDQNTTFMHRPFKVSAPLYFVISTDWDYPNSYGECSGQAISTWMDSLRVGRPGFAFSHFVGAYMWHGETGAARSPALEQWLLCKNGRLPSSGTCSPPATPDEIGVHVHGHKAELLDQVPLPNCCSSSSCESSSPATNCATPACAAPAVCPHVNYRTEPADNWASDASGYAQELRAFGTEELLEILNYSSRTLVRHGFAQPTSFRAGGWASGANVLAVFPSTTQYGLDGSGVLQALGTGAYTVDSSAVPPNSICTQFPGSGICASVGESAGLSATTTSASQPYLGGTVLEVPDNGALVDYRYSDGSGNEIATDLGTVYNGAPLSTPRVYQSGFHSHNWCSRKGRVNDALTTLDPVIHAGKNNTADMGPGVWTTISRLRQSSIASP